MNCEPKFTTVDIFPENIDCNVGILRTLSDEDFRKYVEKIRLHFISLHSNSHPVFATNKTRNDIIDNLKEFNNMHDIELNRLTRKIGGVKPIIFQDENELDYSLLLSYNTKNTNAINHWFPEIWDTKISSGKAVTDQFYDSEQFYKNVRDIIIKDRFKSVDEYKAGAQNISDFLIQCLRIVSGNQPVYNFPSTLAKWIYLDVAKRTNIKDSFNILDTSCGWGGRMLAALSVADEPYLYNKKVSYWGTDPNTKVHDRFYEFIEFWKQNVSVNDNFNFYKATLPAENLLDDDKFKNALGTFDVHFTSPPYFNKELYSNDDTQSYIKYDNDYPAWSKGFLKPMLKNTYDLLKEGGECWINIADVKYKGSKYHPLEADTVKYALECGFEHVKTYKMVFGIMPGNDKRSDKTKQTEKEVLGIKRINKNTGGENPKTRNTIEYADKKYKFEPIFVFKK